MSAPHVGDVITTVEQLYSLPRRTLVAHDSGWGIEFARRATDDGRWYVPGSNESIVGEVLLPAVVVLPPDAMPRPERSVKAEALREAADHWQTGGWASSLPAPGAARVSNILGMAQHATDFLRTRAGAVEAGETR